MWVGWRQLSSFVVERRVAELRSLRRPVEKPVLWPRRAGSYSHVRVSRRATELPPPVLRRSLFFKVQWPKGKVEVLLSETPAQPSHINAGGK